MSDLGNKKIMAENLSFYLAKSGKSQKEMAEIVGVSTSTFNDWMKAKTYPRIDKIEIMAMGYREYGRGWVRFVYDGNLKTPEDVQAAAVQGAIRLARAKAEYEARQQNKGEKS